MQFFTHFCIFPPLDTPKRPQLTILSLFFNIFMQIDDFQKNRNKLFLPVEKAVETVENSKIRIPSRGIPSPALWETLQDILSSPFLQKNHFPRYAQIVERCIFKSKKIFVFYLPKIKKVRQSIHRLPCFFCNIIC